MGKVKRTDKTWTKDMDNGQDKKNRKDAGNRQKTGKDCLTLELKLIVNGS